MAPFMVHTHACSMWFLSTSENMLHNNPSEVWTPLSSHQFGFPDCTGGIDAAEPAQGPRAVMSHRSPAAACSAVPSGPGQGTGTCPWNGIGGLQGEGPSSDACFHASFSEFFFLHAQPNWFNLKSRCIGFQRGLIF